MTRISHIPAQYDHEQCRWSARRRSVSAKPSLLGCRLCRSRLVSLVTLTNSNCDFTKKKKTENGARIRFIEDNNKSIFLQATTSKYPCGGQCSNARRMPLSGSANKHDYAADVNFPLSPELRPVHAAVCLMRRKCG